MQMCPVRHQQDLSRQGRNTGTGMGKCK
jgi:hypothetical protein